MTRVTYSSAEPAPPELNDTYKGTPKKRRSLRWSSLSYTTRMTLSFAAIAAMTALFAILVLSIVWDDHFNSYTRQNMRSIASATAAQIGAKYEEEGAWTQGTTAFAEYVGRTNPGVGVMVVDARGAVRFDSTRALAGRPVSDEKDGMRLTGPSVSLAPTQAEQMAMADIVVDDKTIGSVRVWVYGSEALLRESDIEFRDNSFEAMVLAAVIAIALASVLGYVFARNLVRPINRMTTTAKAIKEGNLSARTNMTGEDEIAHLGATFDAMADSMEQERQRERQLTTDVAHELRTPLMALQSTTEAMIDGVFEPDAERLETVNNEVQRLSRMVNALLELSRLENRSTPFKSEVVDLGELVEQIVSTHEAFVADSGLQMTFKADTGARVLGDADKIRQATANLISNAVRYTPEGGSIHVEVRRGDIMASIAVEDTGIGLTPEEAKQVFDRFWRADAGRQRESGGLGIGLSVVKEIVDRHGGWVQVEGKPDAGAKFTIHIPLYDERYQAMLRERERKSQRAQKGGKPQLPKVQMPKPKAKAAKEPKGAKEPKAKPAKEPKAKPAKGKAPEAKAADAKAPAEKVEAERAE